MLLPPADRLEEREHVDGGSVERCRRWWQEEEVDVNDDGGGSHGTAGWQLPPPAPPSGLRVIVDNDDDDEGGGEEALDERLGGSSPRCCGMLVVDAVAWSAMGCPGWYDASSSLLDGLSVVEVEASRIQSSSLYMTRLLTAMRSHAIA
jgi:hypothetical protein